MTIQPPSRASTSALQKIGLILFGLVLFLVILEAGMRLGGFILLSMQEYGNLRSIKQKGAYRILCLGESTTQGQYPQCLEKALNERNIGVRFSVIDKGKAGTNTTAILGEADTYLTEYHPDMVLAMMGINDEGEQTFFEAPTSSETSLSVTSFRTYKLARLLWRHLLAKTKEMEFYKSNKGRRISKNVKTGFSKPLYVESVMVSMRQDTLSQAEDFSRGAVKLYPKSDNGFLELGRLYREQGEFSQAEGAFKKALGINPKNCDANVELGMVCIRQGKLSRAEDLLKKAVEINPRSGDARFWLAWLYRDQGKFPEAEDSFRNCIELSPRNSQAYFELGALYRAQGKFAAAEDVFNKAIEHDLRSVRIFGALSSLSAQMGKPELAEEYAAKIKDLSLDDYAPGSANNYRRLKKILDRKGIKLVCVQYPMRSLMPLKKIFEGDASVFFVDNEKVFKGAVEKAGYKEYFKDMFAGDFGHCNRKGNELLAQNIADVILRDVFNK